jgi:ribose/xylose/arabinose/galactoside ABC-type transport system permease subunit
VASSAKRFHLSQSFVLLLIIVAIATVTAAVNPRFLRLQNLLNILEQIAILGIVACGVGMLLVSGNIDISVGSQISLMTLVMAQVLNGIMGQPGSVPIGWHATLGIPAAVASTLLLGILLGLVNGLVVVGSRVTSFIITLGFMTAYHGASLLAGSGNNIPISGRFEMLGRGRLFDIIPIPVVLFLAGFALTALVLRFFRYGRHLYAIGGNLRATFASGIKTGRLIVLAYIVVGLCNAIAALVLVSRVGTAQAVIGDTYALDALASVIVGGVALTGGRGNALSILLGVLLIGLISNSLIIMRVSPYARDVVMGLIIIFTVTSAELGRNGTGRRTT